MRVRVLGETEADDGSLSQRLAPQARRLLAALVAATVAGHRDGVTRTQLAEDLGLADPVAVRMAVSRVRKLLGARVVTTGQGYRLDLADDDRLDVRVFEQLLIDGHDAASASARVAALGEALALWRGPAFGTEGDLPTVQPVRHRLDALRRAAIEDLADALLDVGHAEAAILLLEQHCSELRYRERPIELLMRARASQGRLADALRTYERFRIELRDDVGVVPSAGLRALEARLLDDDAASPSHRAQQETSGPPGRRPQAIRGVAPPSPLTPLVGRGDDVRHVGKAIREHRLVTLVGVGGCGKTRLAIEVAAGLTGPSRRPGDEVPTGLDDLRFDEGPWFVALADLGDPTLVVRAIARAMGRHDPISPDDPEQTLDELIRSIGGARVLLVVDNCEHVLEGCSAALTTLASGCPAVRILATSREPLHIAGERIVDVGPLVVPTADTADAVAASHAGALFVDRARAASSDFALDERTAPSIAALCRRLDGLPLALELAAAGIRGRSCADLLRSIAATSTDLAGVHGTTAHHDSMRTALRWSTDLLASDEHRLFRRLAVFRGGFRIDAAEAVGAVWPDDEEAPSNGTTSTSAVASQVASLVDKSLVVHEHSGAQPTRYRLLEVVRDFALSLLDDHDELERTGRRHRDHFLDRCAAVRVWERGTVAFDDLRLELDNFRAAIGWSQQHDDSMAALGLINRYPCWQDLGLVEEHDHLLTAALSAARPGDVPESLLAATLETLSITRTYRGDVVGAEAAIDALDELDARHPDTPDVKGNRAFATATREYLFRDGDIERGHQQMSIAQRQFDLVGRSGAYPAGNQLFAAVLFGAAPPNGIVAAAEDGLTRAVESHGPVIEVTIHALVALWQTVWEHDGSIDRISGLVDELVALGSGWEGNLLTLLLAYPREAAGDTHGAAHAVLDYLRFAGASGLRMFVADSFRSAARLARSRRPDQSIRLWSAADRLALVTGLRDIAIHGDHDRSAREQVAAIWSSERLDQLEAEGRRWTLASAVDAAMTLLDELSRSATRDELAT